MKESILLGDTLIEYTVKRSTRSRSVTLSITEEGELRVSFPLRISSHVAEQFIHKKARWILKKMEQMKSSDRKIVRLSRSQIPVLKKATRVLVLDRLEHFNQFYNFTYNRISIRNQKSRWGSCSRKKNLNFNYKMAALPAHLSDYIVVHELCHLGELNHSKDFWALVEKVVPRWKEHKKELHSYSFRFN